MLRLSNYYIYLLLATATLAFEGGFRVNEASSSEGLHEETMAEFDPAEVARALREKGTVIGKGSIIVFTGADPALVDMPALAVFERKARPSDSLPGSTQRYVRELLASDSNARQVQLVPLFDRGRESFADDRNTLYLVPASSGAICLVVADGRGLEYAAGCDVALRDGISLHFGYPEPGVAVLYGIAGDAIREITLVSGQHDIPLSIGENSYFGVVDERVLAEATLRIRTELQTTNINLSAQ